MEEGGVIEGDPTRPRWIIDPLDGTSNFLHGIPHFAISIAAQEPALDGKGRRVTVGAMSLRASSISRLRMKASGRKRRAGHGCMIAVCACRAVAIWTKA
jgi:fructose-1,6-bisphosphatase/inositol monophosphatase family enzyme